MKKIYFSLLMISALFMITSCGSKSNSSGATASDETETATPTYEPADPPFTFSKVDKVYGKRYENIPLNGVFEIQKVALAKVRGKIEYSGQLSGEGDCISITVYLKMINDYLQEYHQHLYQVLLWLLSISPHYLFQFFSSHPHH